MFDTRVHDYWEPPRCERSRELVDRMCASWRLEAQVVAERLDAIGELFELRRAQRGEEADWAVDTWAAVGAEVAAAFRVSLAMAGSFLRYALAMRERLPRVAAVFRAGDIGFRLFQTIVYRTDLITDAQVLAAVDAELAMRAPGWPSMTRGRLAGEVDKVVAKADVDAVRRREQCRAERGVWVEDIEGGMSEIRGGLFSPDGHALDRRLDALADTVCERDPRSRDQLRADALGALAVSADRLGCRCGRADCAPGARPAASPVVIHVVAEQASVEGRGSAPGSELGADGLISAEVVAELAGSAKLVALNPPTQAEPRYTPSAGLADFVRCRD
ncbi:13E12 repeat family protein, partial [Mycobacterium scrofulaceum]